MLRSRRMLFALCLGLIIPGLGQTQALKVDESIPAYTKVSGISGNLNSVGSDTLNNLMTFWAEEFRKQYPNIRIQIEGKGSSTAPPALIEGTAQIGPMSREMKETEIDAFEEKFGYKPTKIPVAVDALAVFVNKDNPIQQLTLEQVDAIFSKTRRCGGTANVVLWDKLTEVGVDVASGPLKGRPISLYGRNSASGTYGYFKKVALCKGDYRDTVKEQPGSASVVQGISEDPYGIGYSGIGYKTSGVKTVALAKKTGDPYASTDAEDVYSGKYPLARFLYLYVNKVPNQEFDPLVREFMKSVLSQSGQEIVVKAGYLPLPGKVVEGTLSDIR